MNYQKRAEWLSVWYLAGIVLGCQTGVWYYFEDVHGIVA